MRSTAASVALHVALAILTILALVAVAPAPANAQAADDGISTDGGTTTFAFDVRANGDAQATVTVQLPLADDADREAFDRLASDHTSGSDSPLSVEPFQRAAAQASVAAGRSMEVQGVQRTATRSNDTGALSIAFTWTNFAGVSEGRLQIDEAFETPDGTWLPGLAADQELRISFPPSYSAQSISTPGARYQLVNGTVVVEGPATFGPGTPEIVLLQTGSTSGPPWVPLVIGALVVAVLLALVIYYRDRLQSLIGGGPQAGEGAVVANGADPADDPDPMAEPLLSDEERVLKLLEARNGRMKQVEIVEATDWSNAKVSQLLSDMDEAGQVDKLRIGRENLISLPGHGPGSE